MNSDISLRDKLLDRLIITAVTAVDIYFGIYFILCLVGIDTLGMALVALVVMSCATLPILLRERLEKRLGRGYPIAKAIFGGLIGFYVITVVVFWCYIGFDGAKTAETYAPVGAADVGTDADSENDGEPPGDEIPDGETLPGEGTLVVVFGCRAYGLTPGDSLKLRLDEAYELLTYLPGAICIVSGGQGPTETMPESTTMKHYLTSLGIAPERIIEESESHTTSENIRFTKALVESLVLELELEFERVIGVSTAFHLPRIEKLAVRYWQPIEVCAAPAPSLARYYVSMVREYFSYIKMLFFDKAVISF